MSFEENKENKKLLLAFTKVFSAPVALTVRPGSQPEYSFVKLPDEVREIAGLLSYPGVSPRDSLRSLASHRARLKGGWPLSPKPEDHFALTLAVKNLDRLRPDQAGRISRIISSGPLAPLSLIDTAIERTREQLSAQNKNPSFDELFIRKVDFKNQITLLNARLIIRAGLSGREN